VSYDAERLDLLYANALRAAPSLVQDSEYSIAEKWTELEWQALWYSGACGSEFRSTDGALVEILSFGFWNHEPGPDFVHATVRLEGQTVLTGDVEIDLHAQNWERHQHGDNPSFNRVVLHVFLQSSPTRFFTRTSDHRQVQQVLLPGPVRNGEQNECDWRLGACHAPLRNLSDDQIDSVLQTAAKVRFQQKASKLRESARIHGIDEALFQNVAVALGYKANKIPFLIVAQRSRLDHLRDNLPSIDAILFGLAGFLEDESLLASFPSTSHDYVHNLWSTWWRFRGQMHHLILRAEQWRFSGTRPQNHPHRRLGALVAIARSWNQLRSVTQDFSGVETWLRQLSHSFWDEHYSLKTSTGGHVQLIGETRIKEIIANVFLPMFFGDDQAAWQEFCRMRTSLGNSELAHVCERLFGDNQRSRIFTQFVYQQQGLLQVFEDFCVANAKGCEGCQFPRLVERLKEQ
jgi:hypothetical protein